MTTSRPSEQRPTDRFKRLESEITEAQRRSADSEPPVTFRGLGGGYPSRSPITTRDLFLAQHGGELLEELRTRLGGDS